MGWIYHCCNYMDICQQHKKSVSESCDSFDCAYSSIYGYGKDCSETICAIEKSS